MATDTIIQFMAAREFFRLFTGIYADVYRQIQNYNSLKSTNLDAAKEHLKNAITKPANVQDRALEFVRVYGSEELETCLAIITDGVTLAQINSELNSMIFYCNTVKTALDDETATWDQAANNMLGHFEDVMPKISFPFSAGYTDIWGRRCQ